MASQWYFALNGVSNGPVDLERLRADFQSGRLPLATLVWAQGMANWVPANALAEFALTPPPLPPAPSSVAPGGAPVTLKEPPRGPAGPSPWTPQPRSAAPRPPQEQPQTGADGLYLGSPSRTFGQAISVCFSQYVTFSGRASRSEYWYFTLFNALMGIVGLMFEASGASVVSGLISLALFLPSLAVTSRRLHDTDRSAWWFFGYPLAALAFMLLVAVLGRNSNTLDDIGPLFGLLGLGFLGWSILLLVFCVQRGQPGPNRFG